MTTNEELIGRDEINDLEAILSVTNTSVNETLHDVNSNLDAVFTVSVNLPLDLVHVDLPAGGTVPVIGLLHAIRRTTRAPRERGPVVSISPRRRSTRAPRSFADASYAASVSRPVAP